MIDTIKNYTKSKAQSYEIFYSENDALNIELNNDETNFVSQGKTAGFGVRVFKDGKMGFSYTNNLSKYREAIDRAVKIAKLNKKDPDFKNFALKKNFTKTNNSDKELESFDAEKFSFFKKEFLGQLKSVNPKIRLSLATYIKNVSNSCIINSEGVDAAEKITANIYEYSIGIKDEGQIQSISLEEGSKKVLHPEIGKEAGERLQQFLNRKKMGSGKFQLLLHPEALSDLLSEAFSFSINAENVQQKKSVYTDSLNKQVMNKAITIIDDARKKNFFSTRSFDHEGTPSQTNKIIENGVLKNFIHSVYTANKQGAKTTGNAYRAINSLPMIMTNNILMEPGKTKDILGEVEDGLFVKSLLGVHTMGRGTGEFSLGVLEGHKVEKGEIKYPVKDVMISGNVFSLLSEVIAISKKCEEGYYGGGFSLPTTLYPKINIVGQKS
ncbi:TldD/PmbA family protein [Candidatus Woesearchaeota archaeon]|nr:TldD/PmbA family protein [Candidatus Woesearchaeota archaeon]